MVLLKSFRNIFVIPELRRKLLFTLGALFVYRLGTIIPIIGVNVGMLAERLKQASSLGILFNYLDMMSGSAFGKCTVFALGIQPYITASIAMQLLVMSIPSLEEKQKDEAGRKEINQWTRYAALGLAVVYALTYVSVLEATGLALQPGIGFTLMFVITMTAGAMFVMWLGEQISLFGVGNGSSMIIFAGIVARLPQLIKQTFQYIELGTIDVLSVAFVAALFVVIVGCIVFLEKGERKIPVQYARRVIGTRVYGAQATYIPFKINPVGVMPVIFASSALQFPLLISNFLAMRFESLQFLREAFNTNGALLNTLQFVLIIFFTFLYTALVFNPDKLADDIKKSGGFVPGIRPGKKTAQFFDYILNRIGLVGAIYLGVLAIIPAIVRGFLDVPFLLAGTSLLIMVGVALETSAQIETYLIEHRYEGFLSAGRIKDRILR